MHEASAGAMMSDRRDMDRMKLKVGEAFGDGVFFFEFPPVRAAASSRIMIALPQPTAMLSSKKFHNNQRGTVPFFLRGEFQCGGAS